MNAEKAMHLIRVANDARAERDDALKLIKKLFLVLEDVAFGNKKDARGIARRALEKLERNPVCETPQSSRTSPLVTKNGSRSSEQMKFPL